MVKKPTTGSCKTLYGILKDNLNSRNNGKLTSFKFNFLIPTTFFTLIGLFIPYFTALGLLFFQMLISRAGVDRPTAWTMLLCLTTISSIILPIIFIRHIKNSLVEKEETSKIWLVIKLILFNLFEYSFIQASLSPLFTTDIKLTNGTSFPHIPVIIFTAYLSLPILIAFSFIFNKLTRT